MLLITRQYTAIMLIHIEKGADLIDRAASFAILEDAYDRILFSTAEYHAMMVLGESSDSDYSEMLPLADSSSSEPLADVVLEEETESERSSSRRNSNETDRPPPVFPVSRDDPQRVGIYYEVETRAQAQMNLDLMKDDHRRHMQSLGLSDDSDASFHSMPS